MEEVQGRSFGNPLSFLTNRLNIRGKLMLAFLAMIVLTIAVIVITLISQRYARTTIDQLVQVQSRIARLSLETDRTLKQMYAFEKDFLLNYNREGIQEARSKYLNALISSNANAYRNLMAIKDLAPTPQEESAAQKAIAVIGEYTSAFNSTVDIIELRVDPEFGELVKLDQATEALREREDEIEDPRVQGSLQNLLYLTQDYRSAPTPEMAQGVKDEVANIKRGLSGFQGDAAQQAALSREMDEFGRWFDQVVNTDETIANRIAAYQEAVQQADPVIQSFLAKASADEQQSVADMQKAEDLIQKIMIGVGIGAILLGVFIAFALSRGLTRQVNHIMTLLNEMGMGNFGARTEIVSTDEMGTMASALNAMLDNITVLIQSQDERDAIQESIIKLMDEIGTLMEGDLTARAEVTEDITGAIADSFNTMAEQFGDIVRQVKSATLAVDDTSSEVAKLTVDLAAKSQEQTKEINSAIQAINTMAESIRDVSTNALKSADVSKSSRVNAHEGAETVEQTNRAMEEIREQINETARSIKRLGESSMEIGNVVQIINDIADRTSILALNASIQAAMAGDAGHGFAVVAEEVQRLAESSSNSTKQIEVLVKSIQSEIKDVSNRMDESISKVVQGSQLADSAYSKLQEIESVSDQLDRLIESITKAAANQVKVSENIVKTMEVVGGVTKETSIASQDTASSMNVLNSTAHNLRQAVEMFKVEAGAEA